MTDFNNDFSNGQIDLFNQAENIDNPQSHSGSGDNVGRDKIIKNYNKPDVNSTNEVKTIMKLLEYLSDDENYKECEEGYICNPEEKINSRFKNYADVFKEEYTDKVLVYGNILPEVKRTFGLDGVRAIKISNFLKTISNRYLREAENDPQKAFDKLADYFESKIIDDTQVDNGAIRYFLLEELIGCNIFSTKIK